MLTDFIQANFVAEGMCADVCIHDTDGLNPHAHIMLTMRPLTKDGKWQHKTEKEYLCIRNGEERGFTAAEFKSAQSEGWEKQYQYKVGKEKVYIFRYRLLHIGGGKEKLADTLRIVKPDLKKYENVIKQLKGKIRERRTLLNEKKTTPAIQVLFYLVNLKFAKILIMLLR